MPSLTQSKVPYEHDHHHGPRSFCVLPFLFFPPSHFLFGRKHGDIGGFVFWNDIWTWRYQGRHANIEKKERRESLQRSSQDTFNLEVEKNPGSDFTTPLSYPSCFLPLSSLAGFYFILCIVKYPRYVRLRSELVERGNPPFWFLFILFFFSLFFQHFF